MVRTLLWLMAGALLGFVIHIVVILILPGVAGNNLYARVAAIDAVNQILPLTATGAENPLRLDPDLTYAVCRLDLRKGPGELAGALPQSFWSIAVYNTNGTVIYSATNRDATGQTLDLGLFNPAQTRLLAEQQIDVADGLLIVESQADDVFVVVRLAPPLEAMRARYQRQLDALSCGNIKG